MTYQLGGENLTAQQQNLGVTLNGGNRELDSATIPIEWWFSKDLIAGRTPTHILIFEQDESEIDGWNTDNCGRRYGALVDEKVHYLPLKSAGHHRVMVLALTGDYAKRNIQYLLKKETYAGYAISLSWEDIEKGTLPSMFGVVAATVVDVEVPQELFAQRPQSGFEKWLWDLTQTVYGSKPIDQCHYRKQLLFLVPMLLFKILLHAMIGTTNALGLVLVSLVVLYFGFRPNNIWRGARDAWQLRKIFFFDILKYSKDDLPYKVSAYKVWEYNPRDPKKKTFVYMPITPFQLTLVGAFLYGLWIAVNWFSVGFLVIGVLVIAVACFLAYAIATGKFAFMKDAVQDQWQAREANYEQKRQKWLMQYFTLEQQREVVDIHHLPVPISVKARAIQTFHVSYWALKAKLCKPYPK